MKEGWWFGAYGGCTFYVWEVSRRLVHLDSGPASPRGRTKEPKKDRNVAAMLILLEALGFGLRAV